MSRNPWAKHYQLEWQNRAGDPRLPLWLRAASLAYGKHRANGHAPFDAGQVALVLSTVDEDTGEIVPAARQDVYRAVRAAVKYGFLLEGSTSRCLRVPTHAVDGGLGRPQEACKVCASRKEVSRGA